MNDKFDIEKLVQEKFKNFEAEVNPKLWDNIAKNIPTSSGVTTGLSLGAKSMIIGAATVVVGLVTYAVVTQTVKSDIKSELKADPKTKVKQVENIEPKLVESIEKPIVVTDQNDPLIVNNETKIIEELTKHKTENKAIFEEEGTNVLDENTTSIEAVNTKNNIESSQNQETNTQNTVEEKSNSDNVNTQANLPEKLKKPTGQIKVINTNSKNVFQFECQPKNTETLIWDFGDGTTANSETTQHVYQQPGTYLVTLTLISEDAQEFVTTQKITISSDASIDNVPNVITPNGDHMNDEFFIQSTNIKTFSIVIQNQSGQTVFESNDPNFRWDATNMSGEKVEKSIYIYYIIATGTDGTIIKRPGQLYIR